MADYVMGPQDRYIAGLSERIAALEAELAAERTKREEAEREVAVWQQATSDNGELYSRAEAENAALREQLADCTASHQRANARYEALIDEADALRERVRVLGSGIDRIMVGGNHLASALIGWLGAGDSTFPPYRMNPDKALEIIRDPNRWDAWMCWRVLMIERDALAASPEPPADARRQYLRENAEAVATWPEWMSKGARGERMEPPASADATEGE